MDSSSSPYSMTFNYTENSIQKSKSTSIPIQSSLHMPQILLQSNPSVITSSLARSSSSPSAFPMAWSGSSKTVTPLQFNHTLPFLHSTVFLTPTTTSTIDNNNNNNNNNNNRPIVSFESNITVTNDTAITTNFTSIPTPISIPTQTAVGMGGAIRYGGHVDNTTLQSPFSNSTYTTNTFTPATTMPHPYSSASDYGWMHGTANHSSWQTWMMNKSQPFYTSASSSSLYAEGERTTTASPYDTNISFGMHTGGFSPYTVTTPVHDNSTFYGNNNTNINTNTNTNTNTYKNISWTTGNITSDEAHLLSQTIPCSRLPQHLEMKKQKMPIGENRHSDIAAISLETIRLSGAAMSTSNSTYVSNENFSIDHFKDNYANNTIAINNDTNNNVSHHIFPIIIENNQSNSQSYDQLYSLDWSGAPNIYSSHNHKRNSDTIHHHHHYHHHHHKISDPDSIHNNNNNNNALSNDYTINTGSYSQNCRQLIASTMTTTILNPSSAIMEIAKEDERNPGFRRVPVLGQTPRTNHVHIINNIDRNKKALRPYLVRARRILRLQDECIISGVGRAVSTASAVAEELKREKIAFISKIVTDLVDVDEREDEEERKGVDDCRPIIQIYLKRGEYGHLVSDFRRRKIIEIFELHDINSKNELSIVAIQEMQLADKFHSNAELQEQAHMFIKDKLALTLPEFVHYCSILIHPLLLEFHFKLAVEKLGGKVDLHDGPLPAVYPDCTESVLVPLYIGRQKFSKQREHLFESESEKEEENDEDEEDEYNISEDDGNNDQGNRMINPSMSQRKRRKFIGIWQPKLKSNVKTFDNNAIISQSSQSFIDPNNQNTSSSSSITK